MLGRKRLPLILSGEDAECGLACVAMIMGYHGNNQELAELRKRFSVSMNGMSLRNIIHVADAVSLGSRAIKLDIDHLPEVKVPAILHWDLSHFVVLKKATSRWVEINDPAKGYRRLRYSEVSNHFTGVALELFATKSFSLRAPIKSVSIQSLFHRSPGLASAASTSLLLSVIFQILALITPLFLVAITDASFVSAGHGFIRNLFAVFISFVLLQACVKALRDWTIQSLGLSINTQLMSNLVRHLFRLSSGYFEKRSVGDIVSRLASTSIIQDTLTRGILVSLVDGTIAILSILAISFYSLSCAGVTLLAFVANALISIWSLGPLRRLGQQALLSEAREKSFLIENIRSILTVKAMGAEAERESVWRNLFGKEQNALLSSMKVQVVVDALSFLVNGASAISVIAIGALAVMDGYLTVGSLIAIIWYRQSFADRSVVLLEEAKKARLISLHLDRIGDIITGDLDHVEYHEDLPLVGKGNIELINVTFRHGECDRNIFEGLNLSIQDGEFVSIVGESGSGKTTLLKLILGFLQPKSGEIIIAGQSASPALYRSWRRSVGVLSQNDNLMSGFVYENISFFDPEVDFNEVERAAKLANLHDDIEAMPMKYFSLVGDMGSVLSGGQRQRLLLARALYRRPDILIMDEGTANLDERNEELVGNLIRRLPMTRIIVTHRPSLAAKADRTITISRA